MTAYTLPLSDPRASLETVGGKGLSLAKMLQAGLPVPDGFHITTTAYQDFVGANDLQERILAALQGADGGDPAALEQVSQTIGKWFAGGEMPPDLVAELVEAYQGLDCLAVAVRSSATAEDLLEASFAGQQETYLNIHGVEAFLEAVQQCWASLWTARAIAYRLKNQVDQSRIALAVVVQELVAADASGVMFTANPLNGRRDEALINAAWGLGEAVVSGAVTPDTITINKDTLRVVQRKTAVKEVMTVRNELGVREARVPAALRRKPVLRYAQTAALARLGGRIEEYYGMPVDVEWTLADGELAIVQARPITALPPDWKAPQAQTVYARGSLAEHTPGPVTPLFATWGLEIANAATYRMWQRIMGDDADALMPNGGMYTTLNGYVYGGVRMAFKEMPKILKMTMAQIGPVIRQPVERWHAARQELAGVVKEWEQQPVEQMSPARLLAGAGAVFAAACRYFTDIQSTLPAASSSEVLFTRFYESLLRGKDGPPAAVFLLGFDTIALRAEKSLYELSEWLKARPALTETVLETPMDALLESTPSAAPDGASGADAHAPGELAEFRRRFQAHLDTYGRTAYEFDFAQPTPAEAPEPVLEALKGYLHGQARSPHVRQREAVERRELATQAVLQRAGWPRREIFERLLRWAQETAPMREDSIFDLGMGHPLIRRMLGELGRRLAAGGAVAQGEELYWLEKDELLALVDALEKAQPLENLAEKVLERKAHFQADLATAPPVMVPERSGWSRLIHGGEAEHKDGKLVLKGVGTSGGTVTAPACVVLGPEDFSSLRPGDVLVAVTTTPAWTPLFAIASAVVTDIGGPLSHSSIVAREYGIPAVMAARNATRAIRSGQVVTVDGAAGTVTVEMDSV